MAGYDGIEPRLVRDAPGSLVGRQGRYDTATRSSIPEQWRRFAEQGGSRLDGIVWGACHAMSDDGFAYLSSIAADGPLEDGWTRIVLAPAEWAVFPHDGNLADLPRTLHAVYGRWLPASGRTAAAAIGGAEGFLERYGAGFDPATGSGDIEVWLPLEPL